MFWLAWVRVEGPSMEPVFPAGSRVCVNPFPYLWASPRRGDVVVLRAPDAARRYHLKRIIGLPGERITWGARGIRVNGKRQEEAYARIPPPTPGDDEEHSLTLNPGEYFVAGDNRLYSTDSRHYGPVIRSAILGRIGRRF